MKHKTSLLHTSCLALLAALATFNLEPSTAHAQGTAFTYQGRLNSGGAAATGVYDFRFKLYSDSLGNTEVGSSYSTNAVGVANGLFIAAMDFGRGSFDGNSRWLEVDVKTNGGASYTTLAPLQSVTAAPYAVMANSASNVLGVLPVAQLSGTVPLAQLPSAVVTNNESGVTLATLTLSGNLTIPASGIIYSGGDTLMDAVGTGNFFAGLNAGNLTMSGTYNTAIGFAAFRGNTSGGNNTVNGTYALYLNTSGNYNTANGIFALMNNTNGGNNTAVGAASLYRNGSGSQNTASGLGAMYYNSSGANNTAVGYNALQFLGFSSGKGGSNNIALGYLAGYNLSYDEGGNIDIGNAGVMGENNITRIGTAQTATYLAGTIHGNGGGLTNLNAAQVTGTMPSLTLGGNITLPANGIIYADTTPLIGAYGNGNFFAGLTSGNLTMSGSGNTGNGAMTLYWDTSGANNTANGFQALYNNRTGADNTALGAYALNVNWSGAYGGQFRQSRVLQRHHLAERFRPQFQGGVHGHQSARGAGKGIGAADHGMEIQGGSGRHGTHRPDGAGFPRGLRPERPGRQTHRHRGRRRRGAGGHPGFEPEAPAIGEVRPPRGEGPTRHHSRQDVSLLQVVRPPALSSSCSKGRPERTRIGLVPGGPARQGNRSPVG
jgi:hypothetical protein